MRGCWFGYSDVSTTAAFEDDAELLLQKGDTLAVPPHCLFQLANRSNALARALVCISADFQGAYADGREIGTPPWAQ